MIEQNSNFFDQLDGGWGDLIADTYKEANEYKKLVQFTNNNDNDVVYFRNPKNIKDTDFKISFSIYKGVIREAFNLIITEDEGLSIFKDKHIPIYDLKMNFRFNINLYNRNNSSFPSNSVLMFFCKEKETNKEILYSYNKNLKYSNYGKEVKEILEKIKDDIIQANSSQSIRFNPDLLKRLSKNYGDFLEKMKNE